ncbi:MAG: LysR family transcriptional regulator [Myxococcota bacterium]|nr:LysR family transcriptional regulator [Myxococcota bacterium]
MTEVPELRLADLVTLLAVQRTGTISGAARELLVTPSQVSKAVTRLERHYGVQLLSRGARGVAPTAAARRMLPRIANAVEEIRATSGVREDQGPDVELVIAAPSYLLAAMLPAVTIVLPRARLRGLELPPASLRAYLAENVFDVALAAGTVQNLPASWSTDRVGEIRFALMGRPAYVRSLGTVPLSPDRVRELPFIGPMRSGGDRFVAIGDDCPLSLEERVIAHEVQTIGAALEFASHADYVVFGPLIAARRFLETDALVEIPVASWAVRQALHVLTNGVRVLARVRAAVTCAAGQLLTAGVG